MSIDAQVRAVICNEDGSGKLLLEDRPPRRPGDNPGIAGQSVLTFDSAPHDVTCLNGRDIWGGDGMLMHGDRQFARREGYTKIRFTVDDFHGWIMS